MADERIDIVVADKVSTNIENKLLAIASAARKADKSIVDLNSTISKQSIVQQRLATEIQRTNATRARSLTTYQKLATEVQRTAAAKQRAAAASTRAELAILRLKTAQDKLATATNRTSSSFLLFVRRAAAVAGVTFGAREILQSADAYTVLQNKLRNVTETEAQLALVTAEVFRVANESRTGVLATAQAFQRFDLALRKTGASQKESLRLTETINKALVLGGATTAEQASLLLQLSQSFNEGKLRGQEFKTLSQLMPAILEKVSDQLRVTSAELEEMRTKGEITTQVLKEAFTSMQETIDAKFARLLPTLGQAFTVLTNKWIKFVGELNKSVLVTETIGRGILLLANNLELLGVGLVTITATLLVGFLPTLVAATKAMWGFTAAIAANPIGLLVVGLSAGTSALFFFRNEIKLTEDGVVSLNSVIQALTGGFKDELNGEIKETTSLFSLLTITAVKSAKTLLTMIRDVSNLWPSVTGGIGSTIDVMLFGFDALIAKARQIEVLKTAVADAASAGLKTPPGNVPIPLSAGALKEVERLQKQSYDGQLILLQERNEAILELEKNRQMKELIGEKNLHAAKAQIFAEETRLRLAGTKALFSNLATLQNSESKRARRVGKAAAVAGATMNMYESAVSSYATMAEVGGPVAGAIGAAAAIAAGIVNIQGIHNAGNFANGGIVSGTSFSGDNMQANVNSSEMILNRQQQTQLFRQANGTTSGTSSGATQVNVTVENYGSSEISVEQMGPNDVRIIARDVVRQEAPGVIAADLGNANSRTSRAISQNTNSQRRRS